MLHDTFWPFWQFLSQLFGQFGGISKISVVDIDVLRDNRFDPSADTISRLSTNRCFCCRFVRSDTEENSVVAERVGFEPTVRFPAHTLSKRAP
jgi:hypothetical protein